MNWRVLFLLMALVLVWSSPVADRPASSSASMSEHLHPADLAVALMQPSGGSEADPSSVPQSLPAAEEAVVDLVGLLPSSAYASVSALPAAWPGAYVAPSRLAPYLDGLQRPPRVTPLLA